MTDTDSDVLPVALVLAGCQWVVVGSGSELDGRVSDLLATGARVCVVSNAPSENVRTLAAAGRLLLTERGFSEADLDGKWLCVLTDPDRALAQQIARAANARRVLFCAVDQ